MNISMIIPIYRGNQYIRDILKMVAANAKNARELSIELILVNDSPEIELEIDTSVIEGYELSVVDNPQNMGIQAARINGIRAARGDCILLLDQDDKIEDTAIESQYRKMGENPAVVSNGYMELIDGKRELLYQSKRQMHTVNDIRYYFYIGNMIASPGLCLLRKEAVPEIWMNHTVQVNGADDWLLWVLFLLEGNTFVINDECLYTHKNVGTNASNDYDKMMDSSKEALDVLEKQVNLDGKLRKVYERRLNMRKKYEPQNSRTGKLIQYSLNPDILWFLFRYKIGM